MTHLFLRVLSNRVDSHELFPSSFIRVGAARELLPDYLDTIQLPQL